MNLLATNMRRLRLSKKLTQEQMAERLGVSAQSVSRWETGATYPDVLLLPQIAGLFGVLVDDLFRPSPKGYDNIAQRLLSVYEFSHKPEDFFAALEEYEKLIHTGAATANDWRSYGVLHEYFVYHCIKKAIGSYNQAMEMSRKDDPDMFHRALRQSTLLRSRIGQAEECIAERKEYVQKYLDNPDAWVDLAHAYACGNQPENALKTCENALKRFPEEGALYVIAGDACRTLKRYDEAFDHWEKAVRTDAKYCDAMFSMAFCREELKQFEQAAELFAEIAKQLEARGMEVEAQMPREMAEKCRSRIFS